jgi:hypothetical protein
MLVKTAAAGAVVAMSIGPVSLLLGIAAFANPAAQAHNGCLIETVLPGTAQPVATTDTAGSGGEAPASTSRVVLPVAAGTYTITSPYGWRTHPITGEYKLHTGTDFAAPAGSPVMAIADGRVVNTSWNVAYGNQIIVVHTIDGQTVASQYAHLQDGGTHVRAGDTVTAGQHIGDIGSTGYSTGPHLHLEIRPGGANGTAVDPERWLAQHGAEGIDAPTTGGPGCVNEVPAPGDLPGAPTPFNGTPGGSVSDPSGTGGWVTRQMAHLYAETRNAFPHSYWSCYSPRPGMVSDHSIGKACDVTYGNRIGEFPAKEHVAAGWQMSHWLIEHAADLHVHYLIWQGKIWSINRASEGWRPYDGGRYYDPSSPTGGHYDHLHISVN